MYINNCTVTNKFIFIFTELPGVEGTALPTSLVRTTDHRNQKDYGRAIPLKIYYNKMQNRGWGGVGVKIKHQKQFLFFYLIIPALIPTNILW